MNAFPSTDERSKLLQEAVKEIKKTKEAGEEDNPVQQGEVSSSKPATLANDVLGPLLLDALDSFLFVVSNEGRVVFVSENVGQFLGCQPNDVIGKSIYNVVAVRDHVRFSSLLPLTPGCVTGNGSLGNAVSSIGGGSNSGKSRAFTCRMIVKPATSSTDGNCDAKACSYEEMHVSSVVQPFPCDPDPDSCEEKQPCLVCVARRPPPLSESHGPIPVRPSPQTSEIFAATAAAISSGMLGREHFVTIQDSAGYIIDCKVSHLSHGQCSPGDLIGKSFQSLCHPSDANVFTRHLQEVLRCGTDTSSVYRIRLGGSRMIYVQTKSVLASSAADHLQPSVDGQSGGRAGQQQQPTVTSWHSIVRERDVKRSLPSAQTKPVCHGGGAAATAAVSPLGIVTGAGSGSAAAAASRAATRLSWPSSQFGGGDHGGNAVREPLTKSHVDERSLFAGLPPLEPAGAMPDVNFNEYFASPPPLPSSTSCSSSPYTGGGSSSAAAGHGYGTGSSSGGSSSVDGCWDVLGGFGSLDDCSGMLLPQQQQQQQHGSYQTLAPPLHRTVATVGAGGMLQAKVQPLPSAVVLPSKKASAPPSHPQASPRPLPPAAAQSAVGEDGDGAASALSPSSPSSTTTVMSIASAVTASAPPTTSPPAVTTAIGLADARARSSPLTARQQPHQLAPSSCDSGVLRELLGAVDTAGGTGPSHPTAGGGRQSSTPATALTEGAETTSSPSTTTAGSRPGSRGGSVAHAGGPETDAAHGGGGSSSSSSNNSDDVMLRQLLSANDEMAGGASTNRGGSAPSAAACAVEPSGSGQRPSAGSASDDSDRSLASAGCDAGNGQLDSQHTLLKKLLTDDDASSTPGDRGREKSGLLQILLKDEQEEQMPAGRALRLPHQSSVGSESGSSIGGAPKSARAGARRSSSSSGLGSDRHPSGGGQLSKDLSSVLSAIWEKDSPRPSGGGESAKGHKRKLSAPTGDIDSSTADGPSEATAASAAKSTAHSQPERNSVLLNQLLQSGATASKVPGGPNERGSSANGSTSGVGAISGIATRNPQDMLPKDAKNYIVDVRVKHSGEPVLLFGGQELVESNMDKFAQITRRFGYYSDKDGSSVVGWMPPTTNVPTSQSQATELASGAGSSSTGSSSFSSSGQPAPGGGITASVAASSAVAGSELLSSPRSSGHLAASLAIGQPDNVGRVTVAMSRDAAAFPAATSTAAERSSFLSSLYSDAMLMDTTAMGGSAGNNNSSDFDGGSALLLSQISEVHGADDDDNTDFVKKIDDLLGLDSSSSSSRGQQQPKSSEEQLAISAIEQQLRSMEGTPMAAGSMAAASRGPSAAVTPGLNNYSDVQHLLAVPQQQQQQNSQQQPGQRGLPPIGSSAATAVGAVVTETGPQRGGNMSHHMEQHRQSKSVSGIRQQQPYHAGAATANPGDYGLVGSGPAMGISGVRLPSNQLGTGPAAMPAGHGSSLQHHLHGTGLRTTMQALGGAGSMTGFHQQQPQQPTLQQQQQQQMQQQQMQQLLQPMPPMPQQQQMQQQQTAFAQPSKGGHVQAMTRPKDLYLPPQMPAQQHPLTMHHGQCHPNAYGDHLTSSDYGSCPPASAAAMAQPHLHDMSAHQQLSQMMMDTGTLPFSPSMPQQQQQSPLLPPYQRDAAVGTLPPTRSAATARGMPTALRGSTSPMMPAPPPIGLQHPLQRQRSYGGRPSVLATGDGPSAYGQQLGPDSLTFGSPMLANYPSPQQQQPLLPPPAIGTQPVVQRQLSAGASLGGAGRAYESGVMQQQQQQQHHVQHSVVGEYGANPVDASGANGSLYMGADFSMMDVIAEHSNAVPLPMSNQQQQQPSHPPQHVSSQYVRQELRAMCSARSQQQQQQMMLLQQQQQQHNSQQQQQQFHHHQQQQLSGLSPSMETSELPADILDQISELSSEHFAARDVLPPQQQQQQSHAMWPSADPTQRYRQQQLALAGTYSPHIQPSPQLSQKPVFSQQQPDLQLGPQSQQQQQPHQPPQHQQLPMGAASSRIASYSGTGAIMSQSAPSQHQQQHQQLSLMQSQNVALQQQQQHLLPPAPGNLQSPGHMHQSVASAAIAGNLQASVHQQQHASQQQQLQHELQQQYLQQLPQQQVQQLPMEVTPSEASAGGGYGHDASAVMLNQKEEVKRRKEQFRQHKGSFPELFKSQLCQMTSPASGGSSQAGSSGQTSVAADAGAKRAGVVVRPLVPAAVSVLQPEPRTPIDDIRPTDHTNSLLQKLLSE